MLTWKTVSYSFIAATLFVVQSQAQDKPTHTKDTLNDVKENVKSGKAVIVDVREPAEWEAGHVAGAIHLPKSQLDDKAKLADLIKKLDKNKIIYTHCKGGGRALTCGELLKKEGYDVRPLKPGYQQLIDSGLEKAK
ncbi:putative adenylyltransferase/sulfurtransferase MoeZ [Anatilimnocola aggregata]|uniref:Putative adenylyltransferase/sulfurtransferase MoeZ n=1 Tax=Anatilimnocola aggregata TaxID=2528021 RepID=A0A517YGX8_9BACT|nr:rhodanese-like domain-containing protein [Anatilimnocola aggregata]QDU29496.1 putative adenylyltransferase/sulfurtransferase MoeZ [Anatilimnocola aggregata]